VGALEGAVVVGGLSVIGAGLYGMGIPKDSVLTYETAIKSDKFLLLVHGTSQETEKARNVLETTGADSLTMHSGAAVASAAR
jgi:hypothetical protein